MGSFSRVDLALAAEGGLAPGAASVRSVRGRPARSGGPPGPAQARPPRLTASAAPAPKAGGKDRSPALPRSRRPLPSFCKTAVPRRLQVLTWRGLRVGPASVETAVGAPEVFVVPRLDMVSRLYGCSGVLRLGSQGICLLVDT